MCCFSLECHLKFKFNILIFILPDCIKHGPNFTSGICFDMKCQAIVNNCKNMFYCWNAQNKFNYFSKTIDLGYSYWIIWFYCIFRNISSWQSTLNRLTIDKSHAHQTNAITSVCFLMLGFFINSQGFIELGSSWNCKEWFWICMTLIVLESRNF